MLMEETIVRIDGVFEPLILDKRYDSEKKCGYPRSFLSVKKILDKRENKSDIEIYAENTKIIEQVLEEASVTEFREKVGQFNLLSDELRKKNEELKSLEFKFRKLDMTHANDDYYKVYTNDRGQLCYNRDGRIIPIDTEKEFKGTFGRTPAEDDAYLERYGHIISDVRKGKSARSTLVIAENGDMYIAPFRSDTMQHTSSKGYDGIITTGMLILKDGKIETATNQGGHFRTAEDIFVDCLTTRLKEMSKSGHGDEFLAKNFSLQLQKHMGEKDPKPLTKVSRLKTTDMMTLLSNKGKRIVSITSRVLTNKGV
jgi:hypothetical protein